MRGEVNELTCFLKEREKLKGVKFENCKERGRSNRLCFHKWVVTCGSGDNHEECKTSH